MHYQSHSHTKTFVCFLQGMFMLTGGFFRLPNDIPKPVWKYPISYIAFHAYATEVFHKPKIDIYLNLMQSLRF